MISLLKVEGVLAVRQARADTPDARKEAEQLLKSHGAQTVRHLTDYRVDLAQAHLVSVGFMG